MNQALKQFLCNPKAIIGLTILLLAVLAAIFAPLIAPGDPWKMATRPFLPPMQDMRFAFGTDMMGRDIMTGLIHGARVSILVGLTSTLVALVFGLLFGTLAGFYGGWIDDALMRITEFFQTIPTFVFALLLVAILSPSILSIILAIGIVSWPPVARLVRSEFASLRNRDFVRAAEVLGQSNWQIIWGQILPNTLSPVIAMASLMVASAILTEAAISFLGLGDPNRMSWGFMIGAARTVLRQAWWMSFFPGMVILLVVLALNLVGDALNDVLNPRLSRKRRQ